MRLCTKHVQKGKPAVKCNLCELWAHKECAELEDAVFDFMVKQASLAGVTAWICVSCAKFSAKFSATLAQLDKRVGDVEEAAMSNATGVENVNSRVTTVEASVKVLWVLKEKVEKVAEVQSGSSKKKREQETAEIESNKAESVGASVTKIVRITVEACNS